MSEKESSVQNYIHPSYTADIPFFAALCLFLSAIEYAIPKPLPFLRLGLANLPVLLSIKKFRKRDVLLLIVLKIIGQAFISGTLFSYIFVFSATGSFASGITMLFVYKMCVYITQGNKGRQLISDIGLSLSGALANNGAQLLCAKYIVFGDSTRYIAPVLLLSGFITGFILGIFAGLFEKKSIWYNSLGKKTGTINYSKSIDSRGSFSVNLFWFVFSLISMGVFLFNKNISFLWGYVILFYIIVSIRKHKRARILPSIVIIMTVTFFALLSPYGKVLFTVGSWRITKDALLNGLHKSGILVGMVFISQCAVNKNIQLPGKTGEFLGSIFSVFEALTSKKIAFKKGKIISAIDERLCEIYIKQMSSCVQQAE